MLRIYSILPLLNIVAGQEQFPVFTSSCISVKNCAEFNSCCVEKVSQCPANKFLSRKCSYSKEENIIQDSTYCKCTETKPAAIQENNGETGSVLPNYTEECVAMAELNCSRFESCCRARFCPMGIDRTFECAFRSDTQQMVPAQSKCTCSLPTSSALPFSASFTTISLLLVSYKL